MLEGVHLLVVAGEDKAVVLDSDRAVVLELGPLGALLGDLLELGFGLDDVFWWLLIVLGGTGHRGFWKDDDVGFCVGVFEFEVQEFLAPEHVRVQVGLDGLDLD